MNTFNGYYQSPIGTIQVGLSNKKITSLVFAGDGLRTSRGDLFFQECFLQLDDYFNGKRKNFELEIELNGTDFQKQVWKEILSIPFGETRSYLDIAIKLGDKNKARAVGNANGSNPVSIIVPCHRVIGTNGNLTGYAGGLWRKKWLLEHEQTYQQLALF